MRYLLLLCCLFTLPAFARHNGRDPLEALARFKHALAEARKYHQPDEQAEALI